ncbi:hypothetical protein F5888DRAFT_1726977 [Russula emetica]|nr:hypothetical protein F5888DRAFT_1726977 [Russula emetica]
MRSESLLILDETTLFYFNLRDRNPAPEQFADVVKNWVANVEPSSLPASRASETFSAASKQPPPAFASSSHSSKILSRKRSVSMLEPDDTVKETKKHKNRATNNDRPVGAHDDDQLRVFTHAYIPSNIWWMAFQLDPFKGEVDAQVFFMNAAWQVIYGNAVPLKVQANGPLFRFINQSLSDSWHRRIGSSAISIVNAFLESEKGASSFTTDDSRQEFAKTMLEDFRFLYSDTESSNPKKWKGLFRGPLVVQTFSAHFIAIAGAVEIKAYGDPKEAGQLPYGALSLSAAAVERALKLYEIGAITMDIVEASRGTNKISFKPAVLNMATGKTSANSFAFNDANWGSATRGYMKSARGLRPDRFIEIMEMARSFSEARSTPGDRSEHTSTADLSDIRAYLVDVESDKDGNKDDGDYRGKKRSITDPFALLCRPEYMPATS